MSKMVDYSVSSQDIKYLCFGFPVQPTNPIFNELGMQLNYLI